MWVMEVRPSFYLVWCCDCRRITYNRVYIPQFNHGDISSECQFTFPSFLYFSLFIVELHITPRISIHSCFPSPLYYNVQVVFVRHISPKSPRNGSPWSPSRSTCHGPLPNSCSLKWWPRYSSCSSQDHHAAYIRRGVRARAATCGSSCHDPAESRHYIGRMGLVDC